MRTNGEAVGTQPTGLATHGGWVPGALCGEFIGFVEEMGSEGAGICPACRRVLYC